MYRSHLAEIQISLGLALLEVKLVCDCIVFWGLHIDNTLV